MRHRKRGRHLNRNAAHRRSLFRNLSRALVLEPSELEVGAIVWARSVLATEGALERVSEVMAR